MVEFADAKGEMRFISFIGSLRRNIDNFLEFIEEREKEGWRKY